jgi:hypothetical protein
MSGSSFQYLLANPEPSSRFPFSWFTFSFEFEQRKPEILVQYSRSISGLLELILFYLCQRFASPEVSRFLWKSVVKIRNNLRIRKENFENLEDSGIGVYQLKLISSAELSKKAVQTFFWVELNFSEQLFLKELTWSNSSHSRTELFWTALSKRADMFRQLSLRNWTF